MPERSTAREAKPEFDELELKAIGAYLPELQSSLVGERIIYSYAAVAFAIGLITHVVAYLLKSQVTTEPLGVVVELLYGLGFSLWTGVVVAVFVQLLPEAKRRQIRRALDAYKAAQREKAAPPKR